MQFAHTGDDRLTRFLIGVRFERRIFFREFDQGHRHLFLARFRLGFEGKLDNRLGEYHLFKNDRVLFVAQSIARGGVFQTYDRADIAGINFGNILSFVRVHLNETADSFFLLFRGVVNVRARFQNARISAEICERAYERIGSDLESKPRERFVVRSLSFFFFARIGIDAFHVVYVERAGKEVNHRVEQELNALVLIRRAAEHGD